MTQANDEWFYSEQGAQRGPVGFATLRSMASSGQLSPQSLVWREGMTNWFPASSVEGLFAVGATAAMPPTYAGPVMGGPIPMSYYAGNEWDRQYVGFWWRVLAAIIDGFATGIVGAIIGAFIGVVIGISAGNNRQGELLAQVVTQGVGIVLNWLYCALMESSAAQGTLGKMAIGVRVTDLEGNRISFARATGRFFAKYVSLLTLCIGFMMVGFTDRKQGLHDMMAGTLVLKGRPRL